MSKPKRIYLAAGTIIGCEGYTDLKITKTKIGFGYELHSTEGGQLDYYDEVEDKHHEVMIDMEGTPKTNKNFGGFYYVEE